MFREAFKVEGISVTGVKIIRVGIAERVESGTTKGCWNERGIRVRDHRIESKGVIGGPKVSCCDSWLSGFRKL